MVFLAASSMGGSYFYLLDCVVKFSLTVLSRVN